MNLVFPIRAGARRFRHLRIIRNHVRVSIAALALGW